MTEDALAEVAALRRRLAGLEAMLEQKGTVMYRDSDNDTTPEQRQQRMRAEAWRHDPEMETVQRWLERDPDDPKVTPSQRMSSGFYRTNKAAAKAEGLDVSGNNTTGGTR